MKSTSDSIDSISARTDKGARTDKNFVGTTSVSSSSSKSCGGNSGCSKESNFRVSILSHQNTEALPGTLSEKVSQESSPSTSISSSLSSSSDTPIDPLQLLYFIDSATPSPIREALVDGANWWDEAFQYVSTVRAS